MKTKANGDHFAVVADWTDQPVVVTEEVIVEPLGVRVGLRPMHGYAHQQYSFEEPKWATTVLNCHDGKNDDDDDDAADDCDVSGAL